MIFNADTADDSQRAQGRVVREASALSAFASNPIAIRRKLQ